MARQLSIPVEAWPDPEPGRAYPVRVERINRPRRLSHLVVVVKHLDPEQEGRECETQLSIPCRPSGLTAEFFAACGHAVEIGASVPVRDCLGKTVLAKFARSESGDVRIASFEAIVSKSSHEEGTASGQSESTSTTSHHTEPERPPGG